MQHTAATLRVFSLDRYPTYGDGVKHRSIFVLARRRRKLTRYMLDLLAAYGAG